MTEPWAPPRMPEPASRSRDQLVARLGAGGMAEVFLIRRTGPGGFEKFLAVKRIRAGLDAAVYAPMLLDEARLVAGLHHPNIVQVHDAGNDDDGLWFLMEYVHGRSLNAVIARAIQRDLPIPLECASYIAACVGRALHYAHHAESTSHGRLGVIHRDVSPGNILIGYDGVVKLADFGIARASLRQAETQDGTFKGKYGYAAPEQCRGEPLDGASDLFSLGTVLHEMLTRRHLFSGDSPRETVHAVLHAPIPSLTAARADVPEELDALVRRLLARDRAARLASGAEAANALDAIAHRGGLPATRERMAEWITSLFSAEERRIPAPAAGHAEVSQPPLRGDLARTPRPLDPSAATALVRSRSDIAEAEWRGASSAGKGGPDSAPGPLAQASQPGASGDSWRPSSAVAAAPSSAGVATGALSTAAPAPRRRSGALLIAAACLGAICAAAVTALLLGRTPSAPAPRDASGASAPSATAAPTPAPAEHSAAPKDEPGPRAEASPAVAAPPATTPAPAAATVPAPSAPPAKRPPTKRPARDKAGAPAKKPASDSLLERDW